MENSKRGSAHRGRESRLCCRRSIRKLVIATRSRSTNQASVKKARGVFKCVRVLCEQEVKQGREEKEKNSPCGVYVYFVSIVAESIDHASNPKPTTTVASAKVATRACDETMDATGTADAEELFDVD